LNFKAVVHGEHHPPEVFFIGKCMSEPPTIVYEL